MHYIVNLVVGFIFASIAAAAFTPMVAGFVDVEGNNTTVAAALWAVWGVTFLSCLIAPSVRRSLGRGFLISGALIFLLPISAMVLSGSAIVATTDAAAAAGANAADQAATAVGVTLAGRLITAAAGIFGFVIGTIFLLFGLVFSLGGTREVVVVGRRI